MRKVNAVGKAVAERHLRDSRPTLIHHGWLRQDDNSPGLRGSQGIECGLQIARVGHAELSNSQAQCRSRLGDPLKALARRVRRPGIIHDRDVRQAGNEFTQQLELLRVELLHLTRESSHVAARSREACNIPSTYRIERRHRHHDRDACGGRLCGPHCVIGDRDQHVGPECHELGREDSEPGRISLRVALLQPVSLPFDVAQPAQSILEGVQSLSDYDVTGGAGSQTGNQRQFLPLLRQRGQRPADSRAADEHYELAPFHCPMPPLLPTERIAQLSYGLLRPAPGIRPMSQMGHFRKSDWPTPTSALPLKADIRRPGWHVRFVPISLQKSFWGDDRNFLGLLMRFV
jgi:hypothetical protein